MWKKLVREYRWLKASHADLYAKLIEARDSAAKFSQEELVDIAFILRSTAILAEDIRKECNAIREMMEKVACLKWMTDNMNNPDSGKPTSIRGILASGTPDLRQMASLPRPNTDPKGYESLMKSIGAITAARKDLVRPHWPGLTEWITKLAKKGKPLPAGLDPNKTYPLYRLSPLRRRPNVDIDEISIDEGNSNGEKTKN